MIHQKFHFFDPGLVSNMGHHANFCRQIIAGAREQGFEPVVYAHRRVSLELRAELGAIPHFSAYSYNPPFGFPGLSIPGRLLLWNHRSGEAAWRSAAAALASRYPGLAARAVQSRLLDFERHVATTAAELAAIPMGEGDLAFLHSGQYAQLAAAVRFLGAAARPPRLFMEISVDSGVTADPSGALVLPGPETDIRPWFYLLAAQAMAAQPQARPVIGTYSAQASALYGKLIGAAVEVFPMPRASLTGRRPRQGIRNPIIGFIGHQRPDKGFQFVPGLVREIRRARPDVRILVHNSYPQQMDAEQKQLAALAAGDPALELDTRTASSAAWANLLDRCDLIICPYDPVRYSGSTSGVMADAIAEAIPMVLPANTVLSQTAAAYGAGYCAFAAWEPKVMLQAILNAIDGLDGLAALSQTAAARWTRVNSGSGLVAYFKSATAAAI